MPTEFQRKPRPLYQYKHWKAVEYRTFLLYLGPIVLKNNVSEQVYNHFLTSYMAITLLYSIHLKEPK